jgi:hypothetical protein
MALIAPPTESPTATTPTSTASLTATLTSTSSAVRQTNNENDESMDWMGSTSMAISPADSFPTATPPTATSPTATSSTSPMAALTSTSAAGGQTDDVNDWLKHNNDVEPDKEEEEEEEEEEWGEGSFFDNLISIDSEMIEYAADDDTTADAADDAADDVDDADIDDDIVSVVDSVPEPPVIKRKRRKYGCIKNTVKRKGKMQGSNTYQRVLTPDRKRNKKRARILPDVNNKHISQQYSGRNEAVRKLIASVYTVVLDSPHPDTWDDENTINIICEKCNFNKSARAKVKRIVTQVHNGMDDDDNYEYDGKINHNGGRKSTIPEGSVEESIIADKLELGCSYSKTWYWVNDYLSRTNQPTVTRTAVVNAYHRMTKKVTTVKMRAQGNSDEDSNWAKARHRWVTQLLLRLRLHGDDSNMSEFLDEFLVDGEIPKAFDINHLPAISLSQIGFWDEVHKKCWISNVREGTSDFKEFPRDADGKYDPNGTYKPEGESGGVTLTPKYAKEVRLCIGVGIKVNDDEEEEGVRLDAFDYSTKTIVSIKDYKEATATLIASVKKLTASVGTGWIISGRESNAIYRSDDLKFLVGRKNSEGKALGMGKKKLEAFKSMNYNTVGDVGNLHGNDVAIDALVAQGGRGFTKPFVMTIIAVCRTDVCDGEPVPDVNHLQAENPFESRYGNEPSGIYNKPCWEEEIRKKLMSSKHLVCITDLVTHIMRATEKAYHGTIHEEDWMLYHDALIVMTAQDCKDWMKTQPIGNKGLTFYDKWILPLHGLNDGISRYNAGNPVGNSPELMPLDNCLNKDLHEHVQTHIMMSLACEVPRDSKEAFSLSCPNRGRSAYLRIWDPSVNGIGPSSARIIQDTKKVVDALRMIKEKKGAFVDGLAQRPGKRNIISSVPSKVRGGKREKKIITNASFADRTDFHSDLKKILKEAVDKQLAAAATNTSSVPVA